MSPETFQQPGEIPTAVLAMLANRLLIDPLTSSQSPQLDDLADSEAAALSLLLHTLRITDEQLRGTREAQLRLLDGISNLLQQQTLTPERRRQALGRLGGRGLIPLANYALEFAEQWEIFESLFKERKASIKDLLTGPTAFRHLMPQNRGVDFPGVTLLAKRIAPQRSRPFVLLVVAERMASLLRVYSAWRVPLEFVPPTPDPLNLLERFVDQFGTFLRIPGRPSRQLIHYDTIASDGLESGAFPLALQIPEDGPVVGTIIYRAREQDLEIAIAFAISVARYQHLLRTLKS